MASHTARTAASATGAGSQRALPAAMYGNSQRTVATSRSASAAAISSMNAWRMPAPAPCASEYSANAPRGRTRIAGWPPSFTRRCYRVRRMRSAVLAMALAGCHVVSQIDNTRPGAERITHHPDHPTPRRPHVEVGASGALRFVEPLECPTERTSDTVNTTEVITGPNIATFVVGMIATSVGAIVLARGAFGHDTPYIAGVAGLAAGLPLAVGPFLDDGEVDRAGAPHAPLRPPARRSRAASGRSPARRRRSTRSGVEVAGKLDASGAYSVSPYLLVDALEPRAALDVRRRRGDRVRRAPFQAVVEPAALARGARAFLAHPDSTRRSSRCASCRTSTRRPRA